MTAARRKAPAKRHLVVDASVLRGAGVRWPVPSEEGRSCAEVLQTIWQVCHSGVYGELLSAEADSHQGRFGRAWRVRMINAGKWLPRLEERGWLGSLLESKRCPLSAAERRQARKDCHLVSLAWVTDRIILSTDDTAGDLFARLVPFESRLAPVHWINPRTSCGELIPWLEAGAPEAARWQLGSRLGR
jgi:hypothetical protein